jgi:two-component system, LytTR family, response regulator
MRPIRVVIADDEAPARARVRRLLRAHPDLEVVGEAATGTEALERVREARPDLLLLDVQMPAPDGLEVARLLRDAGGTRPHVVFLTAYDAYAVQAFEVHAVDYLMKPFDAARLDRALERARDAIAAPATPAGEADDRLARLLQALRAPEPYLDRLLVRQGQKSVLLRTADVDWVEAAQNYVLLRAGGASYMVRGTLQELEARLDPRRFVRIHRSTIVNLDRVRELHPWSHGDYEVVMADGTKLRLSRRYRDRLPALGGEP